MKAKALFKIYSIIKPGWIYNFAKYMAKVNNVGRAFKKRFKWYFKLAL